MTTNPTAQDDMKLLNCPFCGGDSIARVRDGNTSSIKCLDCQAKVYRNSRSVKEWAQACMDCENAWNTRAAPSVAQGEMKDDEVKFTVFAGELSTQDNLKHLHPELVNQIVQQTWLKAKEYYHRAAPSVGEVLDEALKLMKATASKSHADLMEGDMSEWENGFIQGMKDLIEHTEKHIIERLKNG